MKQQTVLLSVEGGVATITLNRPEVRNALSPRMLEEFGGALDECAAEEEEEVRAVVITGSGPAFCSGGDVGVFTGLLDQGPQEMSSQLQSMADKLHRNVILNPNPPKDTDGRREDSGRGWVRELQGRWPGVLG